MSTNKKIVLISENEELCKSFKRALKAVEGVTVFGFAEDSLKNKNWIILIATPEENIQGLFYEKIRSRFLNPVIVTGFKEEELFLREFPIFYDHPYNHAYIRVPFDLLEFIATLKNMLPISSKAIRKAICGSDSGYKGYLLKLLSHDLLKDQERCMEILSIAGEYLKDKRLSKEIEEAIEEIKETEDWYPIADGLSKKLYNKIKGGEFNA